MLKIGWIVLTQIVLYTSSFAQATFAQSAPQEKWEGYKLVTDVDFQNEKLQDFANNNVFQIITADITNSTQRVRIENTNTTSWTPENEIEVLQLETCKRQGLEKCPILTQEVSGTMFYNKGSFYTCRHGFHNWLYYAAMENNKPIQDIHPPIILRRATDRNKRRPQIIYSSANEKYDLVQISFAQTQTAANFLFLEKEMPDRRVMFKFFDFIQVRISNQSIVSDRNLSEMESYPDTMNEYSEVYILGYPGRREFNIRSVGDSPGDTLMVSNGYIDHSLGFDGYQFTTTAMATGGSSGGPVLTPDGTIIGMTCGADDIDASFSGADPRNFRSYPIPLEIKFFADIWEQYGYPTTLNPALQADSAGN